MWILGELIANLHPYYLKRKQIGEKLALLSWILILYSNIGKIYK